MVSIINALNFVKQNTGIEIGIGFRKKQPSLKVWLFNSKTILFVSLACIKILEVQAIRDGGLQV